MAKKKKETNKEPVKKNLNFLVHLKDLKVKTLKSIKKDVKCLKLQKNKDLKVK